MHCLLHRFLLGAFPANEELVSEDLIRVCAAVRGSKWEEVGIFLVSVEDLDEIRKAYGGNAIRMFRVLEAWKMRVSPTVGELLRWFEEVGVNRVHIKKKYEQLFSRK